MSKNPQNVAGGLKATIHNPNVSESTKQSATERLHQMGAEDVKGDSRGAVNSDISFEDESSGKSATDNHRLGGYKATLKNPNVSQEAKDNAESILKDNDAI